MFCYLYFLVLCCNFSSKKIFSTKKHIEYPPTTGLPTTIRAPNPHHNTGSALYSKNLHNILCLNPLRPKSKLFRAHNCDFSILYGPKYRHFFLITQAHYNVNSPRRGFRKSDKLSSSDKFLPKTYINLVMAASVVIS